MAKTSASVRWINTSARAMRPWKQAAASYTKMGSEPVVVEAATTVAKRYLVLTAQDMIYADPSLADLSFVAEAITTWQDSSNVHWGVQENSGVAGSARMLSYRLPYISAVTELMAPRARKAFEDELVLAARYA